MTPNLMEGRVNQLMMRMAHEVIIVADFSKFGRRSMFVIGKVQDADKIIIDSNIRKEDLNRLNELGVEVMLV